MNKSIEYFESLELEITSGTQKQISFPVEVGNIATMKIRGIIAYNNTDLGVSPSEKAIVADAFFKSGYLKLVDKNNKVKTVNIPLSLLRPSANNGQIFDFQGLMINPKNCQIVLGSNNASEIAKVFYLGFTLEEIK